MIYIILLLLAILLFFFCIHQRQKNRLLEEKINKLELAIQLEKKSDEIYKEISISKNKIPIKEISKEIDNAINESEKRKKLPYSKIEKILENKNENYHNQPYQKNILNDLSSTLSSVKILNNNSKEVKENKKGGGRSIIMNEVINKTDTNVNLNDFIKRNQGYINMDSPKPKKENISFMEEISRSLESKLGPQTIELTDYEKEQEESAIISYKELLKVKEQLYEENTAKENEEFLNDLKALRNNLG